MALSIFIDALPYTEMRENYMNWFKDLQLAELQPNIAYSSCLHWQLYCNKYPDDRGRFVDWSMQNEPNSLIKFLSTVLMPLDNLGRCGLFSKKILDRIIFRGNYFANIPFKHRKYFKQNSKYLFWDQNTYKEEDVFKNYVVISQDEGHRSFEEIYKCLIETIESKEMNIFFNTCFADYLGHRCKRGRTYSERLRPYMDQVHNAIQMYLKYNPSEEILIVSDHGMSTIKKHVDLNLEKHFGKESKDSYIAYMDSCIMCLWVYDKKLIPKFTEYLSSRDEGHLLSDDDRKYYKVENPLFGDVLYILKEGNCFKNNWFGQSIRPKKENDDGAGMHGFWPERKAKDQMASIALINSRKKLDEFYTYRTANVLISQIMLK